MKRMNLYIIGPMRGRTAYNAFEFMKAAELLRYAGYTVTTPVEVDQRVDPAFDHRIHTATREQVFRFQSASLAEVVKSDGIAMLPGWRESRGCQAELDLACAHRIPCGEVAVWLWIAGGVSKS